jgi:hypothetical protein
MGHTNAKLGYNLSAESTIVQGDEYMLQSTNIDDLI